MNDEPLLQQIQQQIASLAQNMATKDDIKNMATKDDLGRIEARLGGVETRLSGVETGLGSVETQVGNLTTDLNRVEGRVEDLSRQMATKDDLNQAVEGIRDQLDEIQAAVGESFVDEVKKTDTTAERAEDHEHRIQRLEHRSA